MMKGVLAVHRRAYRQYTRGNDSPIFLYSSNLLHIPYILFSRPRDTLERLERGVVDGHASATSAW
jgi:hypothetical protein